MNGSDIPFLNACLNSSVTVLLLSGWACIRMDHKKAHAACMISAFAISCVFLVFYLYHKYVVLQGVHTPWPGPKEWRGAYLVMLLTHVVLAIVIVPMAIMTMSRAVRKRFDLHRQIARWTLPIWLYVSITGVLIYVLLYKIWPPAV